QNRTEQTVFIGGSLGFGCPGFSLEAVGADVGAVPGTGRSTCADASWCPSPGHGWCPGLNLNPIEPGQSYETTWNGRIFLEVEVPACFGCDADTTCASELVAPSGPYQLRFATYTSVNDDAATGERGGRVRPSVDGGCGAPDSMGPGAEGGPPGLDRPACAPRESDPPRHKELSFHRRGCRPPRRWAS
ncbi:MAG: hypothetical protein ACRBN8_39320, partial [Nannocystales bacterium]